MSPAITTSATAAAPTSTFPPRRSISKTYLATALSATKTLSFPDTTLPSTTSSSRLGPPLSSSSALDPLSAPAANASSSTSYSSSPGIRHISWSPLGNLIATADSRILRVWNPERSGVRHSTELRTSLSESASASAGPTSSLSRGRSGTSTLSSVSAGRVAGTERVAWDPSREAELCSVSGSGDGTLRFWDLRGKPGRNCTGLVGVGGEGFSVAWRPPWATSAEGVGDGDIVVGRKDDTIVTISRKMMQVQSTHPQSVQTNQIAFSNSGRELLLPTGDGHIKILDYPSMSTLHTLTAHTSAATSVAVCPRGRHIASGGSDALIALYDTQDFVCRHSLLPDTQPGPVRSLSFSFDGSYLCAGGDEPLGGSGSSVNGLCVAHVETAETVATIPTTPVGAAVPCVAWHPNRYWIAYASIGGSAGGGGTSLGGATVRGADLGVNSDGLKIVGAGGGVL